MTAVPEKYADRLAPGIAEYLTRAEALFSHTSGEMTVDQQRRAFTALCRAFAGPHPRGLSVRDGVVPGPRGGIPVRVYRPAGEGEMGGLVYFHGGGWVVGDLDSHDDHCAWMAGNAGVAIIAVDYPLAPEHRHPVPFEACDAAVRHIAAHAGDYGVDPARLGVGGDSAGAALAAAVTLKARDAGGPPLALQLLIYPTLGCDLSLSSFVENADAPGLGTGDIAAYLRLYTGREPEDISDPLAAPLLAAELAGLPPAMIAACELDPLRDEAAAWHHRLREAGVASRYYLGQGLIHGCMRARRLSPAAMRFFEAICAGLSDLGE
ncbi:MAG: alpha/beta hydrolase [Rhodospirillales bacterium]|nr:MAG: alpha/beta hydrolase [Rhodospirillales bacterium]